MCLTSYSQEIKKLTYSQEQFIKNNYNWENKKILILNFYQPIQNCHFDNYSKIKSKSTQNWWTAFYQEVNLTDCSNKFIYSDSIKAKKVINHFDKLPDKENFLFINFFKNHPYCHAIIIINSDGYYISKNSEYTESEINDYINRLRN